MYRDRTRVNKNKEIEVMGYEKREKLRGKLYLPKQKDVETLRTDYCHSSITFRL